MDLIQSIEEINNKKEEEKKILSNCFKMEQSPILTLELTSISSPGSQAFGLRVELYHISWVTRDFSVCICIYVYTCSLCKIIYHLSYWLCFSGDGWLRQCWKGWGRKQWCNTKFLLQCLTCYVGWADHEPLSILWNRKHSFPFSRWWWFSICPLFLASTYSSKLEFSRLNDTYILLSFSQSAWSCCVTLLTMMCE